MFCHSSLLQIQQLQLGIWWAPVWFTCPVPLRCWNIHRECAQRSGRFFSGSQKQLLPLGPAKGPWWTDEVRLIVKFVNDCHESLMWRPGFPRKIWPYVGWWDLGWFGCNPAHVLPADPGGKLNAHKSREQSLPNFDCQQDAALEIDRNWMKLVLCLHGCCPALPATMQIEWNGSQNAVNKPVPAVSAKSKTRIWSSMLPLRAPQCPITLLRDSKRSAISCLICLWP